MSFTILLPFLYRLNGGNGVIEGVGVFVPVGFGVFVIVGVGVGKRTGEQATIIRMISVEMIIVFFKFNSLRFSKISLINQWLTSLISHTVSKTFLICTDPIDSDIVFVVEVVKTIFHIHVKSIICSRNVTLNAVIIDYIKYPTLHFYLFVDEFVGIC